VSGLLKRREFLTQRDLKSRYDVVIVGGGVNGLALAFHLAEYHGIRDVAVLERSYIGSGGSGRNTQVVRATYNTTETVPLYATSLGMYRSLSQELDFNVLFSTQGNLDLCHSPDTLQVEREKVLLHRHYGVDTEILTPEQVHEVCPLVDLTAGGELPVIGASYHPPGAFARHDSVVWGYASAAARRGVEIHQGVEVTGVDVADGACRGVTTNRGPVAAGRVVSAVAGWSSVLARMAGLRLPIETMALQAFVTEAYRPVLWGLVSSMDLYVYTQQTARGELVVGAETLPYNTYSTRSTFDFAAEALGSARVEHDDVAAHELGLQRRGVDVHAGLRPRRILRRRVARHGVGHRPPFAAPGREAAVEHRDRAVADPAQHPPQARGRHAACTVVGHHLVAGPQPLRSEPGREGLRRRQRVAAIVAVGRCSEVAVHVRVQRARDMRLLVGARIADVDEQTILFIELLFRLVNLDLRNLHRSLLA